MPQRRTSMSIRALTAPAVLLALVASAFAVLPAATVEAAVPVADSPAAIEPQPEYGPGRLKNATPMTQGCVVKKSRVVKHLKKGAKCAPGSTKVEFKVKVPTQLCLMPRGVLKSFGSFRTCDARGGFSQRGLANNKTLFCAVPGKQVRWAPKPKKCVRPEKSWTLRNHHPVSLTLGGGIVDENAGKDALVGTLHTVDIDPGDVQRYSLVAGAGSTHNSLFRIADGRLLARSDLDHEAGETLKVRVMVRDYRRGKLVRPFTVTVADVNEAPRDLALDRTEVAENAPVGTQVGTLSASDPDDGDTLTYALDGSALDNDDFEIDGARLLTATSFDHETTPQRSVRLKVTDRGGLTRTTDVTIAVTDVNEAPTALALSRNIVVENAPAGTVVGTIEVTDPDAGAPYRFQVLPGADGDDFAVRGDQLVSSRPLDHEEQETRTVRVEVTDAEGVTFSASLRVRVTDVNEAPTALVVDGDEVAENAPAGTVVSTLTGSDPDDGDTLSYALATGAGDGDNSLFQVVGDELRVKQPLDHEAAATRSVRLKVTDAAGLTFERTLTVDVTDVNEAPTGLRISRADVDENVALRTVVGRLAADDEDADDTQTFSLVTGTGDADNAYFAVDGTQLVTARALDHEAADTRSVRVRVTDAAGATHERALVITVNDLNEGPRDLALDVDEVEENSAVGTVVGSFSASDEDDADALTYALVPGAGDGGNALFDVDGDELVVAGALDHEAAGSHSIRVKVSDGAGEQVTRTFTITVLDVNEAPLAPTLGDDRVREDAPAGTVVGRLTSTDPDGDSLTYALATGPGDDDNDDFEVVGDELRTKRALDFEARRDLSVRVRVSDGSLFASSAFDVTVVDVDEAPTAPALDNSDVDENVTGLVGELSATDQEGQPLTFSLVTGAGDTHNHQFEVVGTELRTKVGLDFEAGATRSVRVQVTDGTNRVATVVEVTVNDVNEAPFALAVDGTEIAENVTGAVGTLSADDVDAGDALTFALVTGTGDTHNGQFEVVGDELRTKAGLDFEAGAARSVRLQVSDRAGLTATKVFEVTVTDVNESPGQPALDNDDVDENAADALVGTLSASDPDARTTLTFSLVAGAGDADNALFTVVGDELRTRSGLDFEVAATRSVRVLVSDGTLTGSRQLTITVNDRNDAPTGIALTPSTVAENAADTVVGALGADDQDGDTLTWSLVSGTGDADNAAFAVDGDELKTRAGLDFEAGDERSVRVQAYDGTARVERALTVTVDDVNETPSAVTLDSLTVAEDTASARVGGLSASDPDGDALTYALVAGSGDTDNALFTIDDGVLRTKASGVDFETKPTRTVRIAASDDSLTGAGTAFTISVVDRNDAPTSLTLDPTRIRLDAAVGDVVGTLAAADVDATTSHTFTDVSVDGTHSGHGFFTIDGDEVKVARSLAGLAVGSVDLRVRVDDPWAADRTQDLSLTRVVRIDLVSARAITLDTSSVDENAAGGTTVGALTYVDPLAVGPYTFALTPGSRDNGDFEVVGHELRTRVTFDHEVTPRRTVEVQVFAGGAALFTATLDVDVDDVNEAPTSLTLSSATVAENAPGATVGTLSGTDPDAGAFLSYTLVPGVGDRHNAQFTIVGGTLRTVGALDFEAGETRQVRVAVSDGSLSLERTFVVELVDRNDAPTAVALSDTTVLDSALAGDVVGTLTATDADVTKPHVFTEVAGGDHGGLLTVSDGHVEVAGSLLGVSGDKTIKVRVTDTWGGVTHTYEQLLTVTVVPDTRGTLALSNDSLPENSASGTTVGDLSFSGVGTGPYTYTLGASAPFTLTGATLRSGRSFDHEAEAQYVVPVTVRDAAGRRWTREVTVDVADVDEAPVRSTTVMDLEENDPSAGFSARFDDPEGAPVTYRFATCGGFPDESHRFTLTTTGASADVRRRTPMDFEDPSNNRVRVCLDASDGSLTTTYVVDEQALDRNEPTTDITLSRAVVDPAVAVGTVVGTLTAVDPDSRKPVNTDVSTTESGAGYFEVVGNELRVARDLSGASATELQVRLRAADSWSHQGPAVAQSFEKTLTISLLQPLELTAPDGSVNENQAAGTVVSTLSVSGGEGPYTYTLDGTSGDNALFEVVGNELRTKRAFNFEVDGAALSAHVKVTDQHGDSASATVAVTVGDVNESSLGWSFRGAAVMQDSAIGTVVGTLTVPDPDARKPNLTVTGVNALYFGFDGDKLVVTGDLNGLAPGPVTVPVTIGDTWGTPPVTQSVSTSFSVTVVAPLSLTAPDGTIPEGQAAGTVVTTLNASGGTTPYTYALDGTSADGSDNDRFQVVGNQVRTQGPLNFDAEPTLTVKVKVTDADGRTTRRTLTVTVTDVNVAPTDIVLSSTSVPENAPVGTVVGTLSAVDADTGDTHVFSRISPGQLSVSGNRLVTTASFNHETTPSVTVTLKVDDQRGGVFQRAVTVTVTDDPEAPTAINLSASDVDEGLPAGTVVGDVTVDDQDRGETHTFTVFGGVPFTVSGGKLRTTQVLDFDVTRSFAVQILVTDKDGLTFTRLVTVTVNDVVYAPRANGETVTGFIGNTSRAVTASVLSNDTDPEDKVGPQDSLSVVAGTLPTTRGGTVVMATDGTFTFHPKAGDRSVTDTLVYTVRSNVSGKTATATLRLEISERLVWYVDDSAAPGGTGTSTSYFREISSVPQLAAGAAPDEVYLADGTYGTVTIGRGRTLRGAQVGLPGLISADPSALAQVSVTGSTPAVVVDGGGTVDGVRMRAVGGAALTVRGSGAVTVTSASQVEGQGVGVHVDFAGGPGAVVIDTDVAGAVTVNGNAAATTFKEPVTGAVSVTNSRAAVIFEKSVTGNVTASGNSAALTFSGPVSGASVTLSGNSSVTTFGGVVTLNRSGGATAFSAVNAGTVTMGAAGNTVTGPANLENTTIGAAGFTLASLNVPSSSVGHGLRLKSVQGQPVIVQGTGTTDSGGTITASTPVLTDGRVSLELNRVKLVSLGQRGVDANALAGPLALLNSSVTGAQADAVAVTYAVQGGALRLDGTTVTGAGDSGVVVTAASGDVPVIVHNSTVSGSGATGAARDGVRVESLGSSQVTTTVTGSTLRDNKGDQVQVVARGTGTSRATITGNTLARSGATGAGQGIAVNAGGAPWTGRMVFDVSNNQVQAVDGAGIVVSTSVGERPTPSGLLEGRVANNVFGAAGCAGTPAVVVDAEGGATLTTAVTGNSGVACGAPLRVSGARGGSVLNLTTANNTWTGTSPASLTTGVTGVANSGRSCLDLRTTAGGITLRALGGQLTLPGYAGAWTAAAVTPYLTANNPGSAVTVPTFLATQAGTAACPAPVL